MIIPSDLPGNNRFCQELERKEQEGVEDRIRACKEEFARLADEAMYADKVAMKAVRTE